MVPLGLPLGSTRAVMAFAFEKVNVAEEFVMLGIVAAVHVATTLDGAV